MNALAAQAGNKPGPFTPRVPIPSASQFIQGGNDVAALVLSDAVLSNMVRAPSHRRRVVLWWRSEWGRGR